MLGTLPVIGHPALVGACSLSSLRDEVRTVPRWVAGWRGDWSFCCRGIPQSAPRVFFFLGKILLLNPVASSVQGRACPLTQPTSPARPGAVRSGSHTAQLSTLLSQRLRVSLGFPLRPYSPPFDFRPPGLSQCCSGLVWQGRGPLIRLSPRSPAAGLAGQAWGCSCPGPCVGPRDLFVLKQSPYLLFSQCPLYFLVSYLHKRWADFGCSLCSSVEWVGISPRCRGKLTPLPPISPPSSLSPRDNFQGAFIYII